MLLCPQFYGSHVACRDKIAAVCVFLYLLTFSLTVFTCALHSCCSSSSFQTGLSSFKALNKKGVLGEVTRSFSLPLTQPQTGVSNWYNFMLLMSSETIVANCAVADRSVDLHSCTSAHKGMEEGCKGESSSFILERC